MQSFRAWLHAKDPWTTENDAQFDFIRDTPTASDFPSNVSTEAGLVRYLERRKACEEAIRAGAELLREWKVKKK